MNNGFDEAAQVAAVAHVLPPDQASPLFLPRRGQITMNSDESRQGRFGLEPLELSREINVWRASPRGYV